MDFSTNPEMAAFLEESISILFKENPVSAVVAATTEDGRTFTGYYNADSTDMAIFAHHINADAMLEVVLNNIDLVRDALDDLEEPDISGVPDEGED